MKKFIYTLVTVIFFGLSSAFGQCPNGTYVNILINPDQYPEESSWAVFNAYGDTVVTGGPYTNIIDYTPQLTQLCMVNGTYTFEMYDQYGDGMNGALWGGQDGSFYVMHCGDTLVEPDSANFGFSSYHGFTLNDCAPPPPIFGCMDSSYVEFLPIATVDTGMCFTPKVFGCTDTSSFNFDPTANTDILIDSCTHTLTLTDLAGNGWAGAYLEVSQGYNFLGFFTLDNGFDTTFTFEISIAEPIRIIFNITQQSQFTSVQCGYVFSSEDHITINAPGGFASPLIPFQSVFGMPYCGNECIEKTYGCIDTAALNYNDSVNTDDQSCYYVAGCMNPIYLEYNATADFDDGSCMIPVVLGCMDSSALNYNPQANTEIAGSCIAIIEGCMNELAFNYNPNANVDDSTCISIIYGCTDITMYNYDSLANTDDNSCIPFVYGCTDSTMFNFNPLANADNNSCVSFIYGCTDPSMLNYDATANTEDFSCIAYIYGCTDSTALNYNPMANTDNNSCITMVQGCMDQTAYNFNPIANTSDSLSCNYDAGCITGPGLPYWLNDPCYAWVIDVDEYCCDNEWDEICQLTYDYCEGTWVGPLLTRVQVKKELIMITDLLGRPAKKLKNTLLLYIYDDGSVEKKLIK